MKSLQYIISAALLFFLAYFLSVILLVTGPIIYTIILVGICLLVVALLLALYSIVKSLVMKLLNRGGRDETEDWENGEEFQPEQPEDLAREVYRDLREDIGDAREFIKAQLSRIWSEVEEDLAEMSLVIQKRSRRARRFWMRKRIEEFIEAHQNTFDLLSQKMSDHVLNELRLQYLDFCQRINDLEKELGDIKASIAMKGEDSGGPYHRLADKTKSALDTAELARLQTIEQSRKRLIAYGVDLDPQQAEVLLSRVDAGDIMRMTTVFSIISRMTEQFAKAKLQSGENLNVTKKYYGIYIALLELQLYIQDEYLNRLSEDYIPGVEGIREDAVELNKETRGKAKSSDLKHRPLYEKNLESQAFTLEVTRIYKDALVADADKVSQARDMLRKHHDIAENTLKTVQVSSDLSALMTQNESLYHDVMALQVPDLVPFENLQMQREFEAVTARLREG